MFFFGLLERYKSPKQKIASKKKESYFIFLVYQIDKNIYVQRSGRNNTCVPALRVP